MVACIGLFVLASLAAESWPCKKTYFHFAYWGVRSFVQVGHLNWNQRYSWGGSGQEYLSLSYLAALKLASLIVPSRLLCLRLISIASTCISLYILYRLATLLFCRPVGLLFVFLLASSPAFIESMRSFGYHPLTHLVVSAACYLVAASANGRKTAAKLAVAACSCLLTLSLYIVGRMVIFLPVIFFGIYGKTEWRKLLMFLLLLAAYLLLLEAALPDVPHFSLRDFFVNPNMLGEWVNPEGKMDQVLLRDRLPRNLRAASGYLLQRDRKPFDDEDERCRLFNVAYTPFFFLGLLVCLRRLKRSNVFVLILFFLFFVVPLAASHLDPRRILLSLYPIYLMIALGLWFVFRLSLALSTFRIYRSIVACLSLALLGAAAGWDIREFLFTVSRPYYDYSRGQLHRVAEFLLREGPRVDSIKFTMPTRDLIWGNPFFVDHPGCVGLVERTSRDQDTPKGLRSLLEDDLVRGRRLLYLYTFPHTTANYSSRDYEQLYSDIRWADQHLSGLVRISDVPGTGLHYVLLDRKVPVASMVAGPIHSNVNLLGARKAAVTAASHNQPGEDVDRLYDGSELTYWHVSLALIGQPTWVMVDFGAGNEKSVRTLAAHPRWDAPTHFFRDAVLWGGDDDKSWTPIAAFAQSEVPAPHDWRRWNFENDRAFRYYKLVILSGHEGGPARQFFSLAELALGDGVH